MIPEYTAAANALIALGFFTIAFLIIAGLVKDRALGVNPLGVATALVFLTCASGHALHAEHYFLNAGAYSGDSDLWHLLVVDSFTLAAAMAYLTQRKRYGLVIRGAHPLIDYQRRLEMSEALRDISQDIAAQTDFDKLLPHVVYHARDLLGGDYAAIITEDESGRGYRHYAGTRADGWDEADWREAVYLPELAKLAAGKGSRHFVIVEDLHTDLAAPRDVPALHRAEGARSVLAVAIRRDDRVSGALMVAYRTRRSLGQEEVASASALAGQAAIAIDKARLIETLRQSDRMKDEFLSAAAHELRTPVTTIKGWAEVLLRPGGAGANERKALETIRGQANRMARLSDDLLAVMRVQPGFGQIVRDRHDLSELVQRAVENARCLDERRVFLLKTPGPIPVEGDQRLLLDMLARLLENAARYSPAGRPIEVEARRTGGEAVVSVTDHGVGIPADRQPHLFEPFYEPIPPGKEGYVGIVSLGLYMSRQIAEFHGGRIWVASTPGEGSTFSVGLPSAGLEPDTRVA